MTVNAQDFINMYLRGEKIQEQLIELSNDPYDKKQPRLYSVREAANLIGISHTHLRNKCKDKLDPLPFTEAGGMQFMTLEQINLSRVKLNKTTGRSQYQNSDCQVIIVGNQKGGSGKSTTVLHLGQGLAQKGSKVCLVDADMQGTLTESHAIRAEKDVEEEDTLIGAFYDKDNEIYNTPEVDYSSWAIENIIRETNWDNLHLIPANQALYEADNAIAINIRNYATQNKVYPYFKLIKEQLDKLRPYYDVILIDSPPNLSLFATCLLYAADSMIIPFQPTMNDILSTFRYWHLVGSILESTNREFDFVRLLFTLDETDRKTRVIDGEEENPWKGKQSPEILRGMIRANYPDFCLENTFKRSAAISKTGSMLNTVYETSAAEYQGNRATLKKAVEMSDAVVDEIYAVINNVWVEQSKNAKATA